MITNSCFQIASGGRGNFFEAIGKIQKLYPSLHRRAILTPLLCSKNSHLRKYATEYLYQVQQSRPQAHNQDCDCSKLNFRFADSIMLTCSVRNRAQLISEGLLEIDPMAPKYRCLTHSKNLCEMFLSMPEIPWDSTDYSPDTNQDIDLITLSEAAILLEIPISYVTTFAKSGYLKSLNLLTHKQALVSKQEVQHFADTYIMATQIKRNSHLSYQHIHTLLASTPCEVIILPFRLQVKLYLRDSVPDALTPYINKLTHTSQEQQTESVVTLADAALQLDLDTRDMRLLADMGIIEAKFYRGKNDVPTRKYCVDSSIPNAIAWRSNYFKLQELSEAIGCSAKMTINVYLKTNFVPYIQLISSTLITKDDATKVIEHHNTYITFREALSIHKVNIKDIENSIQSKTLNPLSRSDNNYLNGLITFPRQGFLDWLAAKYATEKGILRICRQRKIFTGM
ncbi:MULTISPECIES: hypothetical protein [Pseudomonas]|nr:MULTISPECIES: hypothetical protein [Pseudomonas]MCZ9638371.1 hypothetical protein [Pseudomonas putida]QNL86588.1 Uncharacterized protein PPKH_1174 [Pseudomonas putida]